MLTRFDNSTTYRSTFKLAYFGEGIVTLDGISFGVYFSDINTHSFAGLWFAGFAKDKFNVYNVTIAQRVEILLDVEMRGLHGTVVPVVWVRS